MIEALEMRKAKARLKLKGWSPTISQVLRDLEVVAPWAWDMNSTLYDWRHEKENKNV